EILEIFGKYRGLDDSCEAAVVALPPAADAEKRRALIGRARLQRIADESSNLPGDVSLEIIPVRKVDRGGGRHQTVDQRVALRVENPCRLHLRQRIDELLQAQVQRLLAVFDAGVRN